MYRSKRGEEQKEKSKTGKKTFGSNIKIRPRGKAMKVVVGEQTTQ
jgi:hypothetical protein